MKYISMKSLGSVGDMCSQMQQYASLHAVSMETGAEIVLPESTKNNGFGIRLFDVLDINPKFMPDEFFSDFKIFTIDETKEVDSRVFELSGDSFFIDGRFDLFKYWHPKYAKDILSWPIHESLLIAAKNYVSNMKRRYECDSITSIHIRLGDYLLPQHNHFVTLFKSSYYNDAIEMVLKKENTRFLVFTNDINWCKANLFDESWDGEFVNTGNDALDFTIMSLCDNNIIANSSYSWWSAFKNTSPDKMVICPRNYLKSDSPFHHINGNYYPSEWIAINNFNE